MEAWIARIRDRAGTQDPFSRVAPVCSSDADVDPAIVRFATEVCRRVDAAQSLGISCTELSLETCLVTRDLDAIFRGEGVSPAPAEKFDGWDLQFFRDAFCSLEENSEEPLDGDEENPRRIALAQKWDRPRILRVLETSGTLGIHGLVQCISLVLSAAVGNPSGFLYLMHPTEEVVLGETAVPAFRDLVGPRERECLAALRKLQEIICSHGDPEPLVTWFTEVGIPALEKETHFSS